MPQQQVLTLSSRHIKIVRLIAEGDTNAEIGRKLGCAEETVKCELKLIMAKLDCPNRIGVVVAAHQLGLIDVGALPRPTRQRSTSPGQLQPLSGEEARVLAGLLNGGSIREVAEQLGLKTRFVTDARRRIYGKWQIATQKDLVRLGKDYLATLTSGSST